MNPFINLISNIIDLYMLCVFVWFVLGLLIYFKIVNRTHPLVFRVEDFLTRLVDPVLKPIRKYLPPIGGIDISPVILILLLQFVQNALRYYF
jgi:YggT family protein